MKHILLCLFILCACSHATEPLVQTKTYTTAWSDLTVASVSYGYTGDELRFVVFESAHERVTPRASLSRSTSSEGARAFSGHIVLPDGTKADLLSSRRIYAVNFGKFASAAITFSRRQLEAYLKTNPKPPTIEGLNEFVSK